ncbi:hypothetical protein Gogos_007564, partial [Gossypium gossypioides]|nr:hypothetical protein [Gossypium gossypioides]
LGNETTYPKCENGCETFEHVFRDCVTAKKVTQMGVDFGLQRVEIEGDALTIIKKTNINKRDESVISTCIEDINKLKEAFYTYCFSYTAREHPSNGGFGEERANLFVKRSV